MPTFAHQMILLFLYRKLFAFVEERSLGHVVVSPIRVRLPNGNNREPDVIYVKPEHVPERPGKFIAHADLVMEIVSGDPGDHQRDFVEKVLDYAKAGIPEYWIVDPETHSIRVLTLDGDAYKTHGEFGLTDQATSVLLPGFAVSVEDVFRAAEGDGGPEN